jgi:hypothetical protein
MREILLDDLLGVADLAIKEVNTGRYDRAIGMCSYVLLMADSAPRNEQGIARIHALLTRGSARAMLSNMTGEDKMLRLTGNLPDRVFEASFLDWSSSQLWGSTNVC